MLAAATTQILGYIMSKSTQSNAKFWRNIHFFKPIPHSPLQIDVFNGPLCDSPKMYLLEWKRIQMPLAGIILSNFCNNQFCICKCNRI